MHSLPPPSGAEFDQYAQAYDAGMDNSLKRLVNNSPVVFVEYKVDKMQEDLRRSPMLSSQSPDVLAWLDLGCGTGTLLRVLSTKKVSGRFFGCDVSQGMLDQAIVDWPNDDKPSFALVDPNGKLPYQDAFFDVVVISAVLHHIEPQQRPGVYREIARVLKRDGRVYVFEHNLYNPVTRWVVSHTAIDANAILLAPSEVRRGLVTAGLASVRTSYIMFFPPHWQWAGWIERLIAWLPLGGQYVVTARRA